MRLQSAPQWRQAVLQRCIDHRHLRLDLGNLLRQWMWLWLTVWHYCIQSQSQWFCSKVCFTRTFHYGFWHYCKTLYYGVHDIFAFFAVPLVLHKFNARENFILWSSQYCDQVNQNHKGKRLSLGNFQSLPFSFTLERCHTWDHHHFFSLVTWNFDFFPPTLQMAFV